MALTKKLTRRICVMCAVFALMGCVKARRDSGLLLSGETAPSFIGNPMDSAVIGSGQAALPANPGDPFVMKDGSGYHLFVSDIFCRLSESGAAKYGRPVGEYFFSVDLAAPGLLTPDCVYSIGYAFSSDKGLSWTFRTSPVILPASGDAWDSGFNETASVVRKDNALYLFYSAFKHNEKNRYQIGVATLDLGGESIYQKMMLNGAVFDRKGRTEPLLPKRLGGFENNTQEPSVIFRNGNFEVFYTGLKIQDDQMGPNLEGVRGTFLGRAIFDENLVLKSRPTEPLIAGVAVNIEEVVFFNDRYHLFFTTGTRGEMHRGEHIAYMVSNDECKSWSAPRVVLEPRPESGFNNWGIMAPAIVPDEGRFIMFYSAWSADDFPCGINGGRWGMPIANGQKCLFQTVGRAEQRM